MTIPTEVTAASHRRPHPAGRMRAEPRVESYTFVGSIGLSTGLCELWRAFAPIWAPESPKSFSRTSGPRQRECRLHRA
jgi:hypothetical protein